MWEIHDTSYDCGTGGHHWWRALYRWDTSRYCPDRDIAMVFRTMPLSTHDSLRQHGVWLKLRKYKGRYRQAGARSSWNSWFERISRPQTSGLVCGQRRPGSYGTGHRPEMPRFSWWMNLSNLMRKLRVQCWDCQNPPAVLEQQPSTLPTTKLRQWPWPTSEAVMHENETKTRCA